MTPVSVKQIIFHSRPWEVKLHMNIARMLKTDYPDARIVFATFFLRTVEICAQHSLECVYLPDMMQREDDSPDEALLEEIDREIQSSFGTGINTLVNGERFLPDDKRDIDKFLMRHVRVLSRLTTPGTLSISGMYDHFIYCLAGALAIARGGVHIAFVGCGVPGGRVIPLKTPSSIWDRDEAVYPVEMDRVIEDLRTKRSSQRIEYMKELDADFVTKSDSFSFSFLVSRYFRRRRYLSHDFSHGSYFAEDYRPFLVSMADKIRQRLPARRTRYYYQVDSIEDIEQDSGIYVALHMEPESTLLMYSPWLNDQLEYVRMLSVCLPPGYNIYVKENPKMVGVREESYYRALKKIPNVLIVNHTIESAALIQKTVLTTSIAGTVIAEAFLLDKPTLCVGTPPVRMLASFVLYQRSMSDLAEFLYTACRESDSLLPDAGGKLALFNEWVGKSFPAMTVSVFEDDGELHVPSSDRNARSYCEVINATVAGHSVDH